MKKIVAKTAEEACSQVAEMVVEAVRANAKACLGLATGGSMEPVYARLVKLRAEGAVSFKDVSSVNLDEYVGLPPSHPQSYRKYMNEHFFDQVDIDKANTYIPLGMETPDRMLSDFQNFLDTRARDFQLLGVGANGHIGFNEPEAWFEARAHIVTLDERTRRDNARFFQSVDSVPRQAVTMGVGDIMKAARVVMLILGENKLQAVRELFLHSRVTPRMPCTVLKLHRDVTVVLTENLLRAAEVSPE